MLVTQKGFWRIVIVIWVKHYRKALQDKTVQEIYEAVRGIVSDAHNVNKRLAAEIFLQLGLEWTPSQLYCYIQTALGL